MYCSLGFAAALGSWSLISLCFLIAFFVVQYKSQQRGMYTLPNLKQRKRGSIGEGVDTGSLINFGQYSVQLHLAILNVCTSRKIEARAV